MPVDITKRSFQFALRIIQLCRFLEEERKVHGALINQLIRSGTSVGANVEEAQSGQSRADFLCKMTIACKECRETLYWIRLLAASDETLNGRLADITKEADELVSILTAIIKTTRENRI